MLSVETASALPPNCSTPTPGAILCVGNQSGGINISSSGETSLTVDSLAGDITPANGTRGVGFTNVLGKAPDGDNGNPSLDLTTTINDTHAINTHGAEGVFSESKGEDGGDGCHPCSITVPDKTSKIGETGGSVTITTSGPVTTDGKAAIFGWSEGGAGGNGDTGQDGSNGGSSRGVTITVQNSVHTTAASAPGVVALSKGGNGGNGDSNVSGSHGGQGSAAGNVTIKTTAAGSVETQGDNSAGILAQSIGGAGGFAHGGFTFDSAQPGGGAGAGKTVEVDTLADVTTHGNNSIGILAQSIGGGGGAGGFTSTGFTTSGGNGGSAGPGGDINITTGAGTTISTEGSQSSVIYAQSVGGGGGAGSGSFGLFFSSAGDGGAGGQGGNIVVTNNATLIAKKDQSSGIYAQSVGGGGGSGGASGGLVSFGGNGGGGNDAGTVKVDNHGDITVSGNGRFDNNTTSTLSAGIFAQSIGGGGGDGGYSGGLVSFGGSGGVAGIGKRVDVDNTGKIDALCGTGCVGGTAIFAQSVGGGGGNGGVSGGVAAFGGSGSGGGEGGDVLVNNSGSELHATAQNSYGIFAQSVGGGGGNGAFAGAIVAFGGSAGTGSKGGNVTVNSVGKITTEGDDSAGIFAQSVGGGGGNGGGSVGVGVFASFAMGGQGGAGGDGGIVCVNSNGAGCLAGPIAGTSDIKTTGERSSGILAQSIGGGGGNGGFAVSASAGIFGDVSFGFGGKGDQGGIGNNVFVSGGGTITTGTANPLGPGPGGKGAFSNGIDAESIGGGGGNGGFSVAVAASTAAGFTMTMGGAGGSGNTGGIVTVNTQETIVTYGDQANGIVARSVGGGGGSGGFSVGASGSPFASLALVFGGAAGDGGAGQGVSVENVGSITTNGQMSNGITAQSIGGGGGNGGFAVSGAFTVEGGAANMSFGGKGGSGANGGTVHVKNTGGDITTYGDGSIGILAQSIGGGGGNGGFAGGIGLSGGAAYSNTIGGAGGGADKNKDNYAQKVDVTVVGDITTSGNNAAGIQAQSIGGGGGNGGFSISAGAALDSFAIGNATAGRGGGGSTGGEVDVDTTGLIKTGGSLSYGIFAQSIGGGGGSGGFAISVALSESGSAGGNTVGGAGGEGDNGGAVTVTTHVGSSSSNVIETNGVGATGILAQSIGGGGGNGGFAIKAALSISGGAGGNGNFLGGGGDNDAAARPGPGGSGSGGGAVTVNNNGGIKTVAADGIVAQSIGGGGGSGGFSIDAAFSSDGNTTSNAIGGKGGFGGTGGMVQVFNKGDISVAGDGYSGIIAQSIGGGGGNGGFAIAGGVTLHGDAATNSVGGSGGGGGTASEVDVENSNAITVGGKHASGIIAQSIGGGGGNGGFSITAGVSIGDSKDSKDSVGGSGGAGGMGATAGVVKVTTFAGSSITTNEIMDNGIVAQSIGGGGGNGGFSVAGGFSTQGKADTSIGGSCGNDCQNSGAGLGGGGGNTVTVDNAGNITTTKANSIGILAQSIGGGGGNGGFVVTADFSTGGAASSNAIGGTGGNGGNGGAVNVYIRDPARIDIQDRNSTGVLAQSVGGGGGNGGFAIGASGTASSSAAATNSLGGSGGAGGDGGDVLVTTSANSQITTKGMVDNGIVAQSIGGGGGNGGFTISGDFSTSGESKSTIGGSGAAGGGGGTGFTVTVDNAGLIQTDGIRSTGITAQSIGGGGGNGGFTASAALSINSGAATNSVGGSGGKGGGASAVMVTEESTAKVYIKQSDSIGILAQSIGGGGGNGGFSVGAGASIGNAPSAANNLGGSGGGGGTAGTVTVITLAGSQVMTQGTNDHGIVAQSIGGGGGNAGFTVSGSFSMSGGASSNVGGSCDAGCADTHNSTGAGGGDAMKVKVDNAGLVQTDGTNSVGITAQAIGGGGGNGGFTVAGSFSLNGAAASNSVGGSGGNGGAGGMVEVTLQSTSAVNVLQGGSTGVLAQSIGGGGGNGGFSVAAAGNTSGAEGAINSIGGTGGGGGIGNTVTVTTKQGSQVYTKGDNDFGIVAQSIGGGGGNGGFLFSAAFSLSGDAKSNVGGSCAAPPCPALPGGGAGGAGNIGQLVTVDNAGTVWTTGAASIAIVAQSIGGGGGNGGMTGMLSVSTGASATTNAIGGAGGVGGAGGQVLVTNETSGLIHTELANSIGVLAQSIGGGGGNGGFTLGAGVSTGGNAATTAVGGVGGNGGDANTVTVFNNGRIETAGALSAGIVAQSIGGGGGNGGFAVAGTLSLGSGGMSNSAGGGTPTGGGSGGKGGNGNTVFVLNTGVISVGGNNSVGIIAQSIGGGGGNAGFTGSAKFGGGTVSNTVGATGGAGGNGGDVIVTSTGSIFTGGDNSVAVLAQSIGGGGGNGALSIDATSDGSLSGTDLRVGGQSAGSGGAMGTVTVSIGGGMTQTTGALAYGMLAQSIGGGGGNGGLVFAHSVKIGADPTIMVGGTGGMPADANVMVSSNANVVNTTGVAAAAQIVQSIGGGGGVNAMVGSIAGGGIPFNLFVGGNSSGGVLSGSGSTAEYNNSGSISTTGDNAIGAVVQSIGGGGGYGQYALPTVTGANNTLSMIIGGSQTAAGGGNSTQIPTFSAPVSTTGLLAEGLVAQSIGGGGGIGNFVVNSGIDLGPGQLKMAVGGQGGAGGVAMDVTVNSTGQITTTKAGSLGAVIQSIGGGGGIAQAYGVSGTGAFTLGAANGAAGNAGAVNFTDTQAIWTQGVGAHAILAQSIGGGGGFIQAFAADGTPTSLPVLAGAGGGGGNGGAVFVTTANTILTNGDSAFGIIAQSIGGGGGLVGGAGAFANNLPVSGAFAGSVGGAGTAGAVTIDAQWHVVATGLGSTAIYAQSATATGLGSDIGITLGSAATGTNQMVLGGTGGATTTNAVTFAGGANNTLTNYALLTTASLIDGTTVRGGLGNEAVSNYGHLIGSVDLGVGTNTLDIKPYNNNPSLSAGVFDSGATVNLGGPAAGNVMANGGLLSPGAFLRVFTTNENGNYVQTAIGSCGAFGLPTSTCGYFGVDLDLLSSTADRLNATGTANVSGVVVVNIGSPGDATPGTNTVTIISAAGGETHNNLALQAYQTAVATYSLVYPNATDIDLQYKIDFSPAGLTQNGHAVGTAINAIQTAHVPAFRPIAAALFYQPTVEQLGIIYNSLSGEGVTALEQASITSNDLFHTTILNQARFWVFENERDNANALTFYGDAPLGYAAARRNTFAGLSLKDANAFVPPPQRTWRAWTTFNGGSWKFPGNSTVGSATSATSGGGFASGIDYQASPGLMFGAALGYGRQSISVNDRATGGSSDGYHVALYGAARGNNAYAIGSLGGDYFNNHEGRFAYIPGTVLPPLFGMQIPPIPGFEERLVGDFASYSVSGRFETGYKYRLGAYTVTPLAGVNFSSLWMNGFTEVNSGTTPSAIGLTFANRNILSIPGFIGAQFDARQQLANGGSLSGWLRAEWVHEFEPHRTINPAFIAAPGFGFVIEGAAAPTDLARITLGSKVAINKNVAVTADFRTDLYQLPSYSGWAGVRVSW